MTAPKTREVEELVASWAPTLDRRIAALDAEADPEAAPPSDVRASTRARPPVPPSDGSSLFERLIAAGDDPEARAAIGAAWEAERKS